VLHYYIVVLITSFDLYSSIYEPILSDHKISSVVAGYNFVHRMVEVGLK